MEPVRTIEKGVYAGKPRCVGRKCGPPVPGTAPTRYTEKQCNVACAEGSNLCVSCMRQEAANLADIASKKFHGRINGPIPDWSHIEGSAWNLALLAKKAGAGAGAKKSVAKRAVSAATAAAAATSEAEVAVAGAGAPPAAKKAVRKAKETLAEAVKEVKEAEAAATAVVEKALVKATRAAKRAEKEAATARRTARRSSSSNLAYTNWTAYANPFARRNTAKAPARRLMFVPQSMAGPSFAPAPTRRSSSGTHRRRPASARTSSARRRAASGSPMRPAMRPTYAASPYSWTPTPAPSSNTSGSNVNLTNYNMLGY